MSASKSTSFSPPALADVLLEEVRRRCDGPPGACGRNTHADLERTRLLLVLERLNLRTWPDVVSYLAARGRKVEDWVAANGLDVARLADRLELARATDNAAEVPWEGDDWDVLEHLPRRLLTYMRDRPRANLTDVSEAVWGKGYSDVGESAVNTAVCKANRFLRKRQSRRALHKRRGEPVIYWR
jgi:hypothetical protein